MSNRKRLYIFVLILIFAIGIFLRTYHFSDWLHFELDQSRDARVVSLAVESGPENLPLLGPRAGGTFLRLGPVFYYFEYLSALVFGNTPAGMAVANLLFSIASIVLFYFFSREYFSKKITVLLAAIFSTSLFLIMYSRFAWNPNSLIFFELLALYALLKVAGHEEKRRGMWLVIFAFALTVATQLHFLALLALPVISAIFLFIKKPKIPIRSWVVSAGVVFLLYFPVILNEIKTGGENAKEFTKAISGKSNKEEHSMINSLIRNYQENSIANLLVISGSEKGESLRLDRTSLKNRSLICDEDCGKNLPYTALALVIFSGGIFLLIKKSLPLKDVFSKDFVLIVAIWFVVSFAMFTLLAFNLSPRFFLLTAPIHFVFLGFWLELFSKIWKGALTLILGCIFIMTNLYFVFVRFDQMKLAKAENVKIDPDRILKERTRVTLEQEKSIVDFMTEKMQENHLPIFLKSDPQYERSFRYLLEKEVLADSFKPGGLYLPGNYFLIWRTSSNVVSKNEKYLEFFDLVGEKEFGTLLIFQLYPKKEFLNLNSVQSVVKEPEPNNPRRYLWKELFSSEGDDEEKAESVEEEELTQEEAL